jgi:hypothetical protein
MSFAMRRAQVDRARSRTDPAKSIRVAHRARGNASSNAV